MTTTRFDRRKFIRGSAALAGTCACGALGLAGCQVTNAAATPVTAKEAGGNRVSIGAAASLAVGQQLKVTVPGVEGPVLVARISASEVRAVSIACTHWGSEVALVGGEQKFRCDAHGSVFALDGSVLEGPASDPLQRFDVVEEAGELLLVLPAAKG